MPPSDRKGSWHFKTLWIFPGPRPTTAPIGAVAIDLLVVLDSAIRRDLLERETRPPYLRNAQLKYKLSSELEVELNKNPITLHVTGYIQSALNHALDLDKLLRWFAAEWSPVDGPLGRHQPYRDWSRQDPAYWHVQVFGEPALAERGAGKSKVCLLKYFL